MYQIRIESLKKPNIYRVIQMSPEKLLYDLDQIVATAFMIEDEENVTLQSVILNGQKNNRYIQLYDNDLNLFESFEETLGDFFKKMDDEMRYVTASGIELKLTLEQQIEIEDLGSAILDGQGHLFSKKKLVDIDELNQALEFEVELEEKLFAEFIGEADNDDSPDYKTLLTLADEFNKLKPWQYFENEDIIAIQLGGIKYFVSVMGAAGQEFGLMMYDEEIGYASLEKILANELLSDDFSYNLSALTVNYVNRDELEKEDYQLIKDQGLSFRGKKNWIALRTYDPSLFPAQPDAEDTEVMIDILKVMIELTHMRMDGWLYPNTASNEFPLFDVDDEPLQLLGILEMTRIEGNQIAIDTNNLEIANIKKKPNSEMQIEYDLFYLPFPISEGDERPIYPLLNIIADQKTGVILQQETITFPKNTYLQQLIFWEMLKQVPVLPSKIHVTKDTYNILNPLAKLVEIELVVSKLKNIKELKHMMFTDMPF